MDTVLDLPGQAENVVTLANKAIILHKGLQLTDSEEILQKLHEIKTQENFQELVVFAKAEQAFVFTRLGPQYGPQAIALFDEVIPLASNSDVAWLWKFGRTLTRRRLLRVNPQVMSTVPDPNVTAEQWKLIRDYVEITKQASDNLKAKAYAELAFLLNLSRGTPNFIKEVKVQEDLDVEVACEKALALDDEDNSVLCKCGMVLRHQKRMQDSCTLLAKALKKRPSSTGYHHLGLAYKYLASQHKFHCSNPELAGWSTTSADKDVKMMQALVNSPPKGVRIFTLQDKYVDQALQNFTQSVCFSQGANTRALYDLALLQKNLGDLKAARASLKQIMDIKLRNPIFANDHWMVNLYEQLGLVEKELAEVEQNPERKVSHHY